MTQLARRQKLRPEWLLWSLEGGANTFCPGSMAQGAGDR